jgi:DNA ligase-1
MGTIMKPMLAGSIKSLDEIVYPAYCSEKLDGIRCCVVDGVPLSRNFKPIPNWHIRKMISACPSGFDGEIISGKNFQETTHNVMSENGEPDFIYDVFDWLFDNPDEGYLKRIKRLEAEKVPSFVRKVLPTEIKNEKELLKFEKTCLANGMEGVMLRVGDGGYKWGRSTTREGYLLKLKRFMDSEAVVLEIVEKMTNDNVADKDAFGRTKRSTAMDGMTPADTMGALKVRDIKTGIEFSLGSGFNDEIRSEVWANKKKYIGKIVKYKSQEIGAKDAPRFPVFLGFRSKQDM